MQMGEGAGTGQMQMDQGAGMGQMQMGGANTWQDQVNRISYPFTAVAALFAVWVCILLMRATGMVDKFSLISFGLALFFIQSVVGVLFYLTKGAAVSMPMLMFIMSLFNSIALLLIGGAFYRWKRMIG